MAEPFKNLIGAAAVGSLAASVKQAWPTFDEPTFTAAAMRGLEPLELKGRVGHVADTLRSHLPGAWPEAAAILVDSLPPPLEADTEVSAGFGLWPVLSVVERHGAHDPTTSLPALHQMTRRFSAEFAIRPFLAEHPAPTWAALATWVTDPNPHVRRLVSEGSRPRLPWGLRLHASVADPSPGLALLDRLVDDPSAYVRRSVANHLGDVAKDHPDRAVAVATAWLGAAPSREPLVRHALRDLLKKGHVGALALFGVHGGGVEVSGLRVEPGQARSGDRVNVVADVFASRPGKIRVDVVWAWPGARAGWAKKTFRGPTRVMAAGESWTVRAPLSLQLVTTRPLRPGPQRVWLRVSGEDFGPAEFALIE